MGKYETILTAFDDAVTMFIRFKDDVDLGAFWYNVAMHYQKKLSSIKEEAIDE